MANGPKELGERPASLYALDNAELPRWINMGVYGWFGSGKTPMIGTGEDTLILDADVGVQSAQASGSKATVMPVLTYAELQQAYEYLAYGTHSFKWVWLDSISLFMDRGLVDDILVEAAEQNPRQSKDVASQREYLVQQNRIGTHVRQFCALPINFGWTAHVMTTVEAETGEVIYMPMIPGGKGEFSSKICGYMNVVAYLGKTSSGKPRLITGRTDHYYARDRFFALNSGGKPHIDNPTIPTIEALIEQKRKSSGQDQDRRRQGSRRERREGQGLEAAEAGPVRRGPRRR